MNKQDIAYIASLISDPARSAILIALLEGKALTAGELAMRADISPQTASSHLHKLAAGKIITVEAQGRHRYYRLANSDVAHALEGLALIAPTTIKKHSEKPHTEIKYARSCYDHLAGKIGVVLMQAMLKQKLLSHSGDEFKVTPAGEIFFAKLDIDIQDLMQKRRRFAYPCLDWSERVHHLAGSLGASLLIHFINKRWFLRTKQGRALHLTPQGKFKLYELFKIEV